MLDFVLGDGGRGGAGAHETSNVGGVTNDIPRILGNIHLDQDVAREDAALHDAAAAILNLDLILLRDNNIEDFLAHVHRVDALAQVFGHTVFVAGVSVDYIPMLSCGVTFGHNYPLTITF